MSNLEQLKIQALRLLQSNQISDAIDICNSLLADSPNDYTVLNIYGVCLQTQGRYQDAQDAFFKAIEICPSFSIAYINLANLFVCLGQNDDALFFYKLATTAAPLDYLSHYSIATYLFAQARFDDALSYFINSAKLNPQTVNTISQKAKELLNSNNISHAIQYIKATLKYKINDIDTLNYFGAILLAQQEYTDAKDIYTHLIGIEPNNAKNWFNLGLVYNAQHLISDAISCFSQAVRLRHDFAEARWNLALLQLSVGNYAEGWINYEYRQLLSDFAPYKRDFDAPVWKGQPIKDKILLLYDEQGFGDAIQFIRYAVLAKEFCGKLIVQCLQPLVRLFASLSCISFVYARGQPLPHFDYQCSILSLPAIFKTTVENIPATIPYLSSIYSKKGYLREIVQSDKSVLKVGLSWIGKSPKEKSCPLDFFSAFAHKDISFYNIQKHDEKHEGRRCPKELKWINIVDDIEDFADTAAVIEQLDLVISVCTATAHLAGAIGKPVWIMLQYEADWRWLRDRQDSPWYPTAKLFRQDKQGQWDKVIEAVKRELFMLLNLKKQAITKASSKIQL